MVTKRVFLVVKSGIVPCIPKKNPDPYAIPEQPHQNRFVIIDLWQKESITELSAICGQKLDMHRESPVQLPQKQNHCR